MDLPEPLVSAEVDLRDFAFMPLDVVRLRDSDLAATPNGEVFRAAVVSWCVSWHQIPAASLPDDDAVVARLLGYGRDVKGWIRLRTAGALRGFIKCSDGRLYHTVVAEKAIEAWNKKLSYDSFVDSQRHKGRKGAAKRWSSKNNGSGHKNDSRGHSSGEWPDDSLKGQGQGQGQGQNTTKQQPSLDLEAKLRKAAGWENEPHPGLCVTGLIEELLKKGIDLELDVLPTLKAHGPNVRARTSWKYFIGPIVDAAKARTEAGARVNGHAGKSTPLDWKTFTRAQYETLVFAAKRRGEWCEAWGPTDKIPAELMDDELRKICS